MDSNNIDDFSQKAKYIIEKIDEFELRYMCGLTIFI